MTSVSGRASACPADADQFDPVASPQDGAEATDRTASGPAGHSSAQGSSRSGRSRIARRRSTSREHQSPLEQQRPGRGRRCSGIPLPLPVRLGLRDGLVNVSGPLGLSARKRHQPMPLIPATATPAVLGDMHREHSCRQSRRGSVLCVRSRVTHLLGGWDAREAGARHLPRAHPALATAALQRYGDEAIGRPARGIAGPLPANRSVAAIGTVHALSIRSRPVTARSPGR